MYQCRQCKKWMESSLQVYDRSFSFVPFPNVKIDCIKEMGKL